MDPSEKVARQRLSVLQLDEALGNETINQYMVQVEAKTSKSARGEAQLYN